MSISMPPSGLHGFLPYVQYLNVQTGGYIGILLCVAVFFITFFSLKMFGNEKAFVPAAVLTFFSSVIFYVMGIISGLWTGVFLVLACAGVYVVMFREDFG